MHLVASVRHGYRHSGVVGVEYNYRVVIRLRVFYDVSRHSVQNIVVADCNATLDLLRGRKLELRERLFDSDELLVELDHVGILVEPIPIYGVNRVGRFIRVVREEIRGVGKICVRTVIEIVGFRSGLAAQHFVAREEERRTLARKNGRNRQSIHGFERFLIGVYRYVELIPQHGIVVAGNVIYALRGIACERRRAELLSILGGQRARRARRAHVYDGLRRGLARNVTRIGGSKYAAFESVAHVVVEHRDIGHFGCVGFARLVDGIEPGRTARPTLAVNHNVGIDCGELVVQRVHGVDIVQRHEVETESVYFIFFRPILNRINHETTEHIAVGRRLIAAARTVVERPVVGRAEVITGHKRLEIGRLRIGNMVVNNVHNYLNTCVVKRHNHLLHFVDALCAVCGVGRIRALGHVVVERVVAPIILARLVVRRLVKAFAHAGKIEQRLEMHLRDAQILDIIERGRLTVAVLGARFGKTEEFTSVGFGHARALVYRQIAKLSLVNNGAGIRRKRRIGLICPAVGIGRGKVEYHAALAVASRASRVRVDYLARRAAHGNSVRVILAVKVAVDTDGIFALVAARHSDGLNGFAALARIVNLNADCRRRRRPHRKYGFLRRILRAELTRIIEPFGKLFRIVQPVLIDVRLGEVDFLVEIAVRLIVHGIRFGELQLEIGELDIGIRLADKPAVFLRRAIDGLIHIARAVFKLEHRFIGNRFAGLYMELSKFEKVRRCNLVSQSVLRRVENGFVLVDEINSYGIVDNHVGSNVNIARLVRPTVSAHARNNAYRVVGIVGRNRSVCGGSGFPSFTVYRRIGKLDRLALAADCPRPQIPTVVIAGRTVIIDRQFNV